MSVITTADDRKQSAKESVEDAVKSLSNIVIDECWGADDFSKKHQEELYDALMTLIKVKKVLS